MSEIERVLRRVASTPDTKYNKDKVQGHKLEIQRLLAVIGAAITLPSNDSVDIPATQDQVGEVTTTSAAESGMSLVHFCRFGAGC